MTRSTATPFDLHIQPVEQLIYQSDVALAGLWRCPRDAPLFRDSGPCRNHCFVFPRTALRIVHEGGPAVFADPTVAMLYNRGDAYRREPVSERGDECDWFAVAPEILIEALHGREHCAGHDARRPFALTHTPTTSHTYLEQRRLIAQLAQECDRETLHVDEAILSLLDAVTLGAGTLLGGRLSHRHWKLADSARRIIATRFTEQLPITQLAKACRVSPWFLARVFRRITGMTLHGYQTRLRLRASLQRVLDGEDLTTLALDLGFSSHSHFTDTFRRAFGLTPAQFRDSLRARN